ncbi:hypothetical protein NDU88_001553 [Pleurodeles waltl]|uniref:Uncharacterized protein n=1 Tax=Pleurodeles waltl TaxID=8319 RepID=A0AAV7L9U1_PLEWA|nr:hypothetical protein NDU88_001553 [Pleurodeles waltl]
MQPQVSLRYLLLFPEKLKVIAGSRSYFFSEPTDAWDWVEQHHYEDSAPSLLSRLLSEAWTSHRRQHKVCQQWHAAIQGAPTPEGVKENQAKALTLVVTLSAER